MQATAQKPRAGIDTPRADDIITPCEGSRCQCDGWVVTAHPRHTTGGARMNFTTGRMEPFEATPEWVAQQEAQIEQGGRSNVGCGPPR